MLSAMEVPKLASSAYVQLFVRANALSLETVLDGTGLSVDALLSRDFVDYAVMEHVLSCVEASNPEPAWAARTGAELSMNAHGPLGFAALSAPTLRDALDTMATYHFVRLTTLRVEVRENTARLQVLLSDVSGHPHYSRYIIETVLRISQSLIDAIVGEHGKRGIRIAFPWPRPSYEEALKSEYAAPLRFNAPIASLSIPANWGEYPSPFQDAGAFAANIAECREIIAAIVPPSSCSDRVLATFREHFDNLGDEVFGSAPPTLESLAQSMHVTPRTLIRRLHREGTSYRELLEAVRLELAQQMLHQASKSVSQVSDRLGYTDPSNFSRAFRKRMGVTPAAWRRGERAATT